MKVHSNGKEIDFKDLSPSWKVLQMRMKEESETQESTTIRSESQQEEKNGFTTVKSKRKRQFKEAIAETSVSQMGKKQKIEEISVFAPSSTIGELTSLVALDCEYVGIGVGGTNDQLARVSIVNQDGAVVYDKYVKPDEKVTDYRTAVSGIRPHDLIKGLPFKTVQYEIADLLKERTVVGHALHNDFRVLNITHSRKLTRDTAKCSILKNLSGSKGGTPSLKKLAQAILGIEIQQGEHDSITDARVALRLYLTVKKKWEAEIKRFHRNK